jgi:ferric-dicitrate binding protein FerR (iron transport regulator)
MTNYEHIINLLNLYAAGHASKDEIDELFFWLRQGEHDELIRTELKKIADETTGAHYDPQQWERTLQNILKAKPAAEEAPIKKLFSWKRMAAAILFLFVTGAALYYIKMPGGQEVKKTVAAAPVKKDVEAGKTGAILTLADGSHIVLDSAANGDLTVQGAAKVVKSNGTLSYDKVGEQAEVQIAQPVMYNNLYTPKGRQFQLVLPDGTKVWLNAQSSLRFPTAFNGNSRVVELTGEAYFEVFKDASKPFHVKVAAGHTGKEDLDVQAVGTSFNINAYADEPTVQATLIEGSVKLQSGEESRMIVPGQQGVLCNKYEHMKLRKVDTEKVLAWKNGYFILNGTSIQAVMRQLSRWYDIEVTYNGKIEGDDFAGEISRNASLSKVLQMLEYTDVVHFSVEGKKVTVSK